MKRDWDLIRKIMLETEALDVGEDLLSDKVPGHEDQGDLVAAHMQLLHKAGLLDGIDASSNGGPYFLASGLTWDGHEFLDRIRADSVWRKVKGSAQEKGVSLSIDVISSLARAAIKQLLGID